MKTIYGPVASWRLGRSLGIDLICSKEKFCSFDCTYCQLGPSIHKTTERNTFISIETMRAEVAHALKTTEVDVITFAGTGEPTLAKNMNQAIETLRQLTNIPLAVLTNSSLLNQKDIRNTISKLDIVVAKLDAPNEELFQQINQPVDTVSFEDTIKGMKKFKGIFTGKLAVQIMFLDDNMHYANEMAQLVKNIRPDEVQINTPLRPCQKQPLTEQQLKHIEIPFKQMGLRTISVYTSTKPKTSPLDKMELIQRRRSEL